jgi:hypothetical protein
MQFQSMNGRTGSATARVMPLVHTAAVTAHIEEIFVHAVPICDDASALTMTAGGSGGGFEEVWQHTSPREQTANRPLTAMAMRRFMR